MTFKYNNNSDKKICIQRVNISRKIGLKNKVIFIFYNIFFDGPQFLDKKNSVTKDAIRAKKFLSSFGLLCRSRKCEKRTNYYITVRRT